MKKRFVCHQAVEIWFSKEVEIESTGDESEDADLAWEMAQSFS